MTARSACIGICVGILATAVACDMEPRSQGRAVRTERASTGVLRRAQTPEPRKLVVPLSNRARAGLPQDDVVRSLRAQPLAHVEKGVGGRSLGFRVTFADGTRAYFKPEQTFAAHWYSEVAAYHIDRMLRLRRVPPVSSRRLSWASLSQAAGDDARVAEITIMPDGTLRGALIAWIDSKLVPAALPTSWELWLCFDEPRGATPFQRMRDWRRGKNPIEPGAVAPEPDTPDRPAELSDLVLFDYLIGNLDRWGGDFTNVRTLGPRGRLIHLDNANGFHGGRVGRDLLDAQLGAVQRFRRKTIEAIRAFDVSELERRLAREPAGPILDRAQLAELEQRRRSLLQHVSEIEREHGADAMPW